MLILVSGISSAGISTLKWTVVIKVTNNLFRTLWTNELDNSIDILE